MMQYFRYISTFSICLYVISSLLTGIWHTRIESDGKLVYSNFLESFVFLIIVAISLSFILFIDIKKGMKVGITMCNVAMIVFDMVVLFCAFQGIINKFNWGNADFVLFIFGGPLTVLYIIGLLIFIYGYNEELGLNHNT
jgi:hypothetical protein